MTFPALPSLDDTPLPSLSAEMRDKAVEAARVAVGFLWPRQRVPVLHYLGSLWHALDKTLSDEQRRAERSKAINQLQTLCDKPAYAAAKTEQPAMIEALHTQLRHDAPHIDAAVRSLWQSMRRVIEDEKMRGGLGPWGLPPCESRAHDAALVDAAIWLFFDQSKNLAVSSRSAYEILSEPLRNNQHAAQMVYCLFPFAASNGRAQKVASLLRDLLLPVDSTPDPREELIELIRAELLRKTGNGSFDPATHRTLVHHAMDDGFGHRVHAEAGRFVASASIFADHAWGALDVTNDSPDARRSLQPGLAAMIDREEFPTCPDLCEVAAESWRELLLRQATCIDMPGTVNYLGELNNVRDAMKRADAELDGPHRPWTAVGFNRGFALLSTIESAVKRAILCLWRGDVDATAAATRNAVKAIYNSSAHLRRWQAQVAFAEQLIEQRRSAVLPAETEAFDLLRTLVIHQDPDVEASTARVLAHTVDEVFQARTPDKPFTIWWSVDCRDNDEINSVSQCLVSLAQEAIDLLWPIGADTRNVLDDVLDAVGTNRTTQVRNAAQARLHSYILDARKQATLDVERHAFGLLSDLLLYQNVSGLSLLSREFTSTLEDVRYVRRCGEPWPPAGMTQTALPEPDGARLAKAIDRAAEVLATSTSFTTLEVEGNVRALFVESSRIATERGKSLQIHQQQWCRSFGLPDAEKALSAARCRKNAEGGLGWGGRKVLEEAEAMFATLSAIVHNPGSDTEARIARLDAASDAIERITAENQDRFRATFLLSKIGSSTPAQNANAPIAAPENPTMQIDATAPTLGETGWSANGETSWSPGDAPAAPSPLRVAVSAAQLRVVVRQSRLAVQGTLARAMGALGAPGTAQAVVRSDVFGALAAGLACVAATQGGHEAVAEELATQALSTLGGMALDTFSGPLLDALLPLVQAEEHVQEILPALAAPGEKLSPLWQGEQSPAPVRIIDAPTSEGDRDPDKE